MVDAFMTEVPTRAKAKMASALPVAAFRAPRTVRFSHCDPAGIVYTPNYIDLMNGVIEDFFCAALGLDYYAIIRDRRIGLGFAQVHCTFFRPSIMGDNLDFRPLIGRIGGASLAMRIHAHRDEEEVARGEFVLVTTELDRHKPTQIPDDIRAALSAYQDLCR